MIAHDGPLALARPPLPALAFRWRGKWLDLSPALHKYARVGVSHTVILHYEAVRAMAADDLTVQSFEQKALKIAGASTTISTVGVDGKHTLLRLVAA